MFDIVSFTLGPAVTNAYLVADTDTQEAVVIDPAWDGEVILREAEKHDWRIAHLWYTHAHFDHIGGAAVIADGLNPLPLVALHPLDHDLWKAGGGGQQFGVKIDPGPEPTIDLNHGQILKLGKYEFEVRHTPGHTPGMCSLYVASESTCFCGDLIFRESVGRTDFPGGDWDTLVKSIHEHIFTLPDDTRLLTGHGPETTVGEEKRSNPFVGVA